MSRALAYAIIILSLIVSVQTHAASAQLPVVLVFETVKGEGADRQIAASTTRAIRTYFRETMRVDAMVFDRESPTVTRAIMEKNLTADLVASYASRDQRLTVAGVLSFQYATGAETSVKGSVVQVKLWLGQVGGGKKGSWETAGTAVSGGGGDRDLDNAMQSAASAAVRDLERQALGSLPRTGTGASAVTESPTAETNPTAKPPTAQELAAQADASLLAGNIALAIQQYSQAVSTEPSNAAIRVKLAEAFARRELYKEAEEELGRAATAGAATELVDAARKRIEQMKAGQKPEPTPLSTDAALTATEPTPVPDSTSNPDTAKPANASAQSVAKMIEGDSLWRQGKYDEAADAYREAARLNPGESRAYERLAVVTASISLFSESRKALEQLGKVQPDPSPQTIATRYDMLRKAFDRHFASLLRHYDADSADYAKRIITRESYYNSIKGLATRLEAMAKFLDALRVPATKEPAHLHRSLACGLMAQAANSLLENLETNNEEPKTDAGVFVTQAKKEIETAAKLEANKIVVEKEPAPESTPEPAPELVPESSAP